MGLFKMGITKIFGLLMLQVFCLSRAQEPYILRYAEQQQQISPIKVGTYDLSQMGFYLVTQWIGIAEAPNEKCIWFNKVYTTNSKGIRGITGLIFHIVETFPEKA